MKKVLLTLTLLSGLSACQQQTEVAPDATTPSAARVAAARTVYATSTGQSSFVAAEIDCKSKLRSAGGNPNNGLQLYSYSVKYGVARYGVSCSCLVK